MNGHVSLQYEKLELQCSQKEDHFNFRRVLYCKIRLFSINIWGSFIADLVRIRSAEKKYFIVVNVLSIIRINLKIFKNKSHDTIYFKNMSVST